MAAHADAAVDPAAEESPRNRTPSAYLRLLRRVEESERLDPAVDAVEPLAGRLVTRDRLRRLLHGEATGIPLHIIYTDLPLGAWWMAQFLDLFPDEGTRPAATRLVGLGVVGAVPTALTGWAQWTRVDRGARRVGILHATANAVATLVFVGSWVARARGQHARGVRLGRLGGLILLAAAMSGGYLRSDRPALPEQHQGKGQRLAPA